MGDRIACCSYDSVDWAESEAEYASLGMAMPAYAEFVDRLLAGFMLLWVCPATLMNAGTLVCVFEADRAWAVGAGGTFACLLVFYW